VGLGAAAVFYGAAAGLSYAYRSVPGMKDLRTPVVGPWLAILPQRVAPPPNRTAAGVLVALRTVLMTLDGAAQAGSLVVVLEGLFMPTQQGRGSGAGRTAARPFGPTLDPSTFDTDPGQGDKKSVPSAHANDRRRSRRRSRGHRALLI